MIWFLLDAKIKSNQNHDFVNALVKASTVFGSLGFSVAIVLLALPGCAGLPSAQTVDPIAEDACRVAFGAERERAGLSLADVVNMADEFCGLQKNMAPFRRAILGASREQSGAMRVEMGAE